MTDEEIREGKLKITDEIIDNMPAWDAAYRRFTDLFAQVLCKATR